MTDRLPEVATAPDRGTDQAGDDGRWLRVHPLTPLIRSWQIVAVIAFFVVQDFGQNVVQGEPMPWEELPDGGLSALPGRFLAGGSALAVLALVVGATYVYLAWRNTTYRVGADALELHTGVLFRQQRRARLDRLQAVDVSQPLLARIAGLARLTLEVAGAGDSKIQLAYLSESDAQRLRAHLLARAAGVRYDTEEAPQAPEHVVLEVAPTRLVGSLALSSATVILVIALVGIAVMSVLLRTIAPAAGAIPAFLGVAGVLWNGFTSGFGFRIATSPDGVRLRRGLLEQRAQTVPPGRVQAVRVSQPILWRVADWWKIEINVAGYGQDRESGKSGVSVLLPVGTRAEALRVLALVLPDLGDLDGDDPHAVVDAALSGRGDDLGFVPAPPAARWLDPLAWWRIGYRVTGRVVITRGGTLVRVCDIVPHARTQSLGLTRGPLQRRLGLATAALHSTPGPVSVSVPHLDMRVAARFVDEQSVRSGLARVTAGPERWMEQQEAAPAVEPDVEQATDAARPLSSEGSSPAG